MIAAAALAVSLGFYQWVGVAGRSDAADVLTQARRAATTTGAKVFRLYLGTRYDYVHHPPSLQMFAGENLPGPLTPARVLALARYRAVLEDPQLETVILTTYTAADYGGGPDDLSLLRPWTPAAGNVERGQIRELCEFLYANFGGTAKTVVIANSEADDKMLDIANYSGSPERAVSNIVAWTRARHDAIEQARTAHPDVRLQVLHGFEISLVNLAIARRGTSFRKSPSGEWNALRNVAPQILFDLLLYSAYESINSPYETQNINSDPAQIAVRLRRDLDRVRDRSRSSLSPLGKRLFGDRFVAAGEIGFARDRFEPLPTGGVLPRLTTAIRAAAAWGCPYIVLWQVFDAPRTGREPYGYGMIDSAGQTPRLQPASGGCDSVRACVMEFLRQKR